MGEHVHVRLSGGIAVTDDGLLVEHSHCLCGETWTRTYRADEGDPELG